MVQPTEQLDNSPDNLFARLVTALRQEHQARQGKIDLPSIQIDDHTSVTPDEVRSKVEALRSARRI
jgi:hypothetical protein